MGVAANAQAAVPAVVPAADDAAVGWMWVPTSAPPLLLPSTVEAAGAAAAAGRAAGATHARRAPHPLIALLKRHRSEIIVAAAAAALAPGVPPLLSALAARSAAAAGATTWGTNLVSQTVAVQAVLRAPGARRALALVAKLQAPARRWVAVATVAGAQGLRKLLPQAAAGASKAAPAAADALHHTLHAVQSVGTLVLGLAGGLLWSQ